MGYSLSIHSNTSIPDTFSMPISLVKGFFDSKTFKNSQEVRKAENKMQADIINRLNAIISAFGNFAKALSGAFRR